MTNAERYLKKNIEDEEKMNLIADLADFIGKNTPIYPSLGVIANFFNKEAKDD